MAFRKTTLDWAAGKPAGLRALSTPVSMHEKDDRRADHAGAVQSVDDAQLRERRIVHRPCIGELVHDLKAAQRIP
jgi:hypothetical protein